MPEVRPIDANALLEEIKHPLKYEASESDTDIDVCMRIVENAPTLDNEPVVHAHWKIKIVKTGYWYECSNCGSRWVINGETHECEQTPYCCYCGAKMDEEVKG